MRKQYKYLIIITIIFLIPACAGAAHPIDNPYTYEDMLSEITELTDTYPEIKKENIGHSVAGTPIHLLSIGKGKKQILIVGTLHARVDKHTPGPVRV